ncbi:MAG TPA: hypothetical protein VFP42_14525 [Acidimicrobiia bacterium]|nr:hypothetical protein [Acidimicrobiia bacterium]
MPDSNQVGLQERDRLAERVSAASYGTVLIIASLLVVNTEDVESGWGWELVVGVGVATWLAHLYAEVLGNHVRNSEATRSHELRKAMADGLPILLAALLPAMALLLGRIGILKPPQALWVAVIVSILQLVAIGVFVGITSEQTSNSWRYAAMAAGFGLAVVALLVALGH